MARKPRDYRAEEARRNALARERGFKSRAQQRHAIETGKAAPLQASRLSSPQTIRAQRDRLAALTDFERGIAAIKPENRARDWSDIFARSEEGQYRPERAKELGVSREAYTLAYINAFVYGEDRYDAVRHKGGSDDLYYWFVVLNEYLSAAEYEGKYASNNAE